ncbi:AAA family ATPase [Latilactobacillus sakei]|nr:AAA family ATPase [Latilactobacillus sakei]USG05849.1 hypothetical protein A4W88_04085 [Latilactobacillus sakei]GEP20634.1 hypothetical protein LSA03nite_02220 [Latilactobacillus sakei subsp. carnosus]SOB42721.1 conserved hypothetical protein [Latilactobacillus sakei]SON67237.1 conserved protein of unknown function [Latilactobacillus sakei]
MMEVKKAKREQIKVPIMITGASGSGKTVSALLIAKGIVEKKFPDMSAEEQWEKIGLIDTEHKRALLYADTTVAKTEIGEFLHVDFEPPFTVNRYIEAFEALKEASVEVVIVDSLTHAWSGEGGILEQVETIQKGNPKMQMMAWNRVKPLEKQFLNLVTGSSVYVIGTARSKQAYDMNKTDGKTQVVKMGLKPDQKDSLEYEFAISIRIDQDHIAEATKDNSNLFGTPFEITPEVGQKIYEWSSEGIDLEKVKRETIQTINDLKSLTPEHEKMFTELHSKVKSAPLETLPIKLLERMVDLLGNIEIKEDEPKPEEVSEENDGQ